MSQLDIKAVAKARGVRLIDLAANLGITYSSLHLHITGNPSVQVLQRIAAALGCDVVDLFSGAPVDGCRCPYCGGALKICAG